MIIKPKVLCARACASAIAAALALSPVHATIPKPIVDLSKSPAISGKPASTSPATQPSKARSGIGPFDQQTLEIGGGIIVLVALGAGAFALSRRRTDEDAQWYEDDSVAEQRDPLFDEPMFQRRATNIEPSAFAWGNSQSSEQEQSEPRHQDNSALAEAMADERET